MSVPSQPNEYSHAVGTSLKRPAMTVERPAMSGVNEKNEIPTKWFYICYNTRPTDRPLAFEGCDLRGLDQWTDLYLQWSVLERSDLRNLTLIRCDLEGANLCSVDLRGANLQNVNLKNAILDGANLSHAQLQGVSLHNASLKNVQAEDCRLMNVDMHGANLTGAAFNQSKLEEVNMTEVTCEGSSFRFSKLLWVTFAEESFAKADMRGAEIRRKSAESSESALSSKQESNLGGAAPERGMPANGPARQDQSMVKGMPGNEITAPAQGPPQPSVDMRRGDGMRGGAALLDDPQFSRPHGQSVANDSFGPPAKRPYDEGWGAPNNAPVSSMGQAMPPHHGERPVERPVGDRPPILGDRPGGDRPPGLGDRPMQGDRPLLNQPDRPMVHDRPVLHAPLHDRAPMHDRPPMHDTRMPFDGHPQEGVRPPLLGGSPGGPPGAQRPMMRPTGPGVHAPGGHGPGNMGVGGHPGPGAMAGPGGHGLGPGLAGIRPGLLNHRPQRPPHPDGLAHHHGPRMDTGHRGMPFGPRGMM